MITTCATDDQLLEAALGDAREREAQRLDQHLGTCPACRRRMEAWQALLGDLHAAPTPNNDGGAFAARLMARVAAGGEAAHPARARWMPTWPPRLPAVAAAVAVAAVVLVVTVRDPLGRFTARGGLHRQATQDPARPSTDVLVLRARRLVPATAGPLRPGDALAVRYSNPTPRTQYLMAFALDAAGAVHWLHPAYLDPRDDPAAVPLAAATRDQLLAEVVQPDHPAAGPMRVVTLVWPTPHHVREIEARLASARPADSVRARFPEADVQEWSLSCAGF